MALRKRSEANAVSRAKHPDDPGAFLPSELALDDAIRALQRVAPFPDLFPALLSTDAVDTLVGLLSHDNADIAGAVLEVLQELTDVDAEGEDEEGGVEALAASAASLARSFVAAGGGEAAAERLSSFDEAVPEEANFLFAGLGALLNMAELDEGCARSFVGAASSGGDGEEKAALTTKKLLPWLLRRVSSSPSSPAASEFSSIAQAASELVSTLAQAGTAGALAVVRAGGVDALLRALAKYRKRAPGSGDELEHAANLFDALCALLLRPEGREAFVEAEGVELLLLLVRKHGSGSGGGGGGKKERAEAKDSDAATAKLAAASATALSSQALRCLEFATTSGGDSGGGGSGGGAPSSAAAAAAGRVVEGGGLGPLFGGLMGRSRLGRDSGRGGGKSTRKGFNSGTRACLGLVVNLLQRLDPEGEEGEEDATPAAAADNDPAAPPPPFARVLSKFREAGFEKLDRLVDLAAAASAGLAAHDARVAVREKLRAEEAGEEDDEEEDGEAAARKQAARLSAGGDDLQLCSLAAAYCWSSFSGSSPSLGEGEGRAARAHFVRALHARAMTLSGLRRALEERRAALGGGGEEGKSAEERRLTRLIAALGGGKGKGGDDSEQQRPGKRART